MQPTQQPLGTPPPARTMRIGKRHDPGEFGMPGGGDAAPKKKAGPAADPKQPLAADPDPAPRSSG